MKQGGSFQKERFLFCFKSSMGGGGGGGLTSNSPVRTPLLICHKRKLLYIYCFIATEMTKIRLKRHIAKVNLPLLLHHNKRISRLNMKVGWNGQNVGNFCKVEGRANKRRIILKKISFTASLIDKGRGVDPRTPLLAYATVRGRGARRLKFNCCPCDFLGKDRA